METFPLLPSKQYSELRQDIRSGDILLCSGNSLFSDLIKKTTNSIWSHVAFILRLDEIDRLMVLESVESIGVRTVPLSHYIYNYNASGKGYPGKLMLARHQEIKSENIGNLSREAVDFLGYPYRTEEILHIATRLSMHALHLPSEPSDPQKQHAFICSEYAYTCFKSIGITIPYNQEGFIAPDDFAKSSEIKPLCFLETSTLLNQKNVNAA